MKNLSVVIPAYNEEDNIRHCLAEVYDTFPDAEIIVVNDASTDRTLEILKDITLPNLRIVNNIKNLGHGATVKVGIMTATRDYVLYIDADRQISLYNMINPAGYVFISGYRVHRNDKLFRKIISFCLKMTILVRYGYYIKDANCPFKIYKRDTVQYLIQNHLVGKNVIPIACLEVLARKYHCLTKTIPTPHDPYDGERKGFLQSINPKMLAFLWSALKEVVTL